MSNHIHTNRWFIGALASVMGFFVGQAVSLYTFNETQQATKKVEEVRLSRDLYSEFYFEREIYKKIRQSIESCEPLYKSWGGKYSHDEINQYLGFFSDLGFLSKKGFLREDVLAHFFGAYTIEAFENKEIKKYISLLRDNFSQPKAFENFEYISKVFEKMKEFSALTNTARHMCEARGDKS